MQATWTIRQGTCMFEPSGLQVLWLHAGRTHMDAEGPAGMYILLAVVGLSAKLLGLYIREVSVLLMMRAKVVTLQTTVPPETTAL